MHDKTTAEWTWIPADARFGWFTRPLWGLVLAIASLTTGVVIGRLSVVPNRPPLAVQSSPFSLPPLSPERREAQPTMALKSDADGQPPSTAAAPPKPAVLLNPGTTAPQNTDEEKTKSGVQAAHRPVDHTTALSQHVDASDGGNDGLADSSLSSKSAASSKSTGTGSRTLRQRTATKRQSTPQSESDPRTPERSTSRNYQDLRTFMLTR